MDSSRDMKRGELENVTQTLKKPRAEAASEPLFLDNLPAEVVDNVLECVLRSLSCLPNARNWESHVPLRRIMDLFEDLGVLGRGLRTRLGLQSDYAYLR